MDKYEAAFVSKNSKVKELAEKQDYKFSDLVAIMELLRSPGGCPWDREQTHESIRQNLIEETYEAIEAIDTNDPVLLCEELGDVLLQVVFHSRMAQEAGEFDIGDVINGVCKKLVERHPHIFGSVNASTSSEVLKNWDEIKRKQKKLKTTAESMEKISKSLPALMRAEKIGDKAKKVGFDFPDKKSAADKVREELDEVLMAKPENVEEEVGDLLFSVVNLARICGVKSEAALAKAADKFVARFSAVEKAAIESGTDLSEMPLEKADILWNKVKEGGVR